MTYKYMRNQNFIKILIKYSIEENTSQVNSNNKSKIVVIRLFWIILSILV